MEILQIILLLAGGIVLLYYGGKYLVRGASSLALRLEMSELIVGMTIVAMGTSAPEAFVSIIASIQGSPGIAMGNVIGSNIANIGLALGLAAIIKPVLTQDTFFRREFPFMLIASITLAVITIDRHLSRFDGILFLILMAIFIVYCIRNAKNGVNNSLSDNDADILKSKYHDIVFIVLGLLGLAYGSDIFVDGATRLARILGISEFVIGLTIVALGTSLPEVTTLLVATIRGKSGIAIGTIIGSNIFNILLVLGIAGTICPFKITEESYMADITVMLVFAAIIAPLAYFGKRVARWEGILLLSGYIAYIAYIVARSHS
ncbi:calcium/sodium antiporter [bacterium]|nr:calcium/sodium antiporter [bacterium]